VNCSYHFFTVIMCRFDYYHSEQRTVPQSVCVHSQMLLPILYLMLIVFLAIRMLKIHKN